MTGKFDLSRLDVVAARAMSEKGPLADLASDWEHDQREAILLCAAEEARSAILSEIKSMGYVIVKAEYETEIGDAGQKYMDSQGARTYATFRYEEMWHAMRNAAPKLEE